MNIKEGLEKVWNKRKDIDYNAIGSKLRKIDWITLLICLMVPQIVGLTASTVSGDARGTYSALAKPPLAAPGWLFGVVWPILYILMGISIYLICVSNEGKYNQRKMAFWLFGIQLLGNFLWNVLFFRFDLRFNAFLLLVVILIVSVLMALSFWNINKKAAFLIAPYLLWLLYALYLNFGVWILNK